MKAFLYACLLWCALCGTLAPVSAAQDEFDLRRRPDGRWLLTRYLGPDSVQMFEQGPVRAFATAAWAGEARDAARIASTSLPQVAGTLGIASGSLAPTWILISPGGRALAREAPEWSAAIAEPDRHLIVLSGPALRTGRAGLEATVVHELVHLALHARLGPNAWVPRWFDEGMAMHLAGALGWRDRISLWGRGPIHLHDLTDAFPRDAQQAQFAYVESEAAVRRLVGRGSIVPLLNRLQAGQDFDVAFERSYGETLRDFEGRVQGEVANRWRWWTALGGGVSLGGLMGVLAIVGGVRVRLRNRRRLGAWATEEQRLRAASAGEDLPWDEPVEPVPAPGIVAPPAAGGAGAPPAGPLEDPGTRGPTGV